MTRHRAVGEIRVQETSVPDTVRLGGTLLVPWPVRGQGPGGSRLAALTARLGADRRLVRLLAHLRRRYGPGPLRLAVPGRRLVLPLLREDVRRLLADSSGRFTPAIDARAKVPPRLQAHGVPAPAGEDRQRRRRADETVLDTYQVVHRLAGPFMVRIYQEAAALLGGERSAGRELTWREFSAAFGRLGRRLVLGDSAREDRMLTELLARTATGRRRRGGRERIAAEVCRRRLRGYVERAEADSLVGELSRLPEGMPGDPVNQVSRWLAGFEATALVSYRTLALLAAHPGHLARVRGELSVLPGTALAGPVAVPYLRACVLEAARLWPVARTVLRQSRGETVWHGRTVPAGSVFVIVVPFFNRDREALAHADRFAPEVWLDGRAVPDEAVVPFGGGAGRCAGENLALLAATTFLAALLRRHEPLPIRSPRLGEGRPVPYGLDHFATRLTLVAAPTPNR